jgi:DNA repair photolyase
VRKLPVQNPTSRFDLRDLHYDEGSAPDAEVQVLDDQTRGILSKNTSPDIGFRFSVNPYRGCMHACAYCYARPTHEYLGLGAGTDFDRKIVVKREAAALLREAFEKRSWKGERVVFSGVTDCYQPLEAKLGLTRACLEVCLAYRNPVGIITKSALIERDIDVLAALAKTAQLYVGVSLPFLDAARARALEPYAPSPATRLRTMKRLAEAGITVGVSVAPVIPGLSDAEIPGILGAAKDHGATSAGFVLLRLPGAVKEVFEERLRQVLPLRAEKVLRRIREAHGGDLYRAEFGTRHRGTGTYAEQITTLFEATAKRLGFDTYSPDKTYREPEETTFRRPTPQLGLFG